MNIGLARKRKRYRTSADAGVLLIKHKQKHMEAITIETLYHLCVEQMINGNKDKKILISADDEGNDYHQLFHSFSDPQKIFGGKYSPCLPYGVKKTELEDYIVLG